MGMSRLYSAPITKLHTIRLSIWQHLARTQGR